MRFSKAALAAMLAIGGSATLVPTDPADAQRIREREREQQREQAEQPQQQNALIPQLNRAESDAIRPLYLAVQARDWAAANAALAAAQAGAQSAPARYLVGQLLLEIGRGTNDTAIQSRGVDAMLASGATPAEVLPQLLAAQAGFAIQGSNFAAAEPPLTRLLEMNPGDVQRITQLAQVKLRLNKREDALALFQRAIAAGEAGGQRASEDLYRRGLAIAYEARMAQPALELSRTLIQAYPTPTNWRDALVIYRELGGVDAAMALDLRRLMRAAQALASERDYVEFADELSRGGLPGEVKAVLEDGIARGVLRANHPDVAQMLATANARVGEDRASLAGFRTRALAAATGRQARTTADAYYGYGQYREAAELYRAALEKGGEDANLVNLRLGAALALAGQRAEAEAAFRAVTGPRAQLANYWLIWLAGRG